MIRIYHTDEGIRATTGIWLFDSIDEAKPTIEAYEEGKKSTTDSTTLSNLINEGKERRL